MDELIARLESATEGGYKLDDAIYEWLLHNGHTGLFLPFTTSLDAALTLLKEGWGWTCNKTITFDCGAQVFGHDIHADGNAKTPALAMCSAALRARSHTAPQEK